MQLLCRPAGAFLRCWGVFVPGVETPGYYVVNPSGLWDYPICISVCQSEICATLPKTFGSFFARAT